MTTPVQEMTGAEEIVWDLSDLIPNADDENISKLLNEILAKAEIFAGKYRGRVASLNAAELAQAMREQEEIGNAFDRVATYAGLQWTTETTNPNYGALMQKITEFGSKLEQTLVFFSLEWASAPDESATVIANDAALTPYKHYLTELRKLRPHQLSEAEEKIISEKDVTGVAAWQRFMAETLSRTEYELDGQKLPQEAVARMLYKADRELRQRAADSLTAGLKTTLPSMTYLFNIILAEKAAMDRLRKFPTWVSSRNLSNETTDEAVEALVSAVTSRYDIVARYYNIKKRLLGYDELYEYDRYAPIGAGESKYNWGDAKNIVLNAFGVFHEEIGAIAEQFFTKSWIHAPARQGKRSGAFAAPVPSVHPYVFVNFSGSSRDVMTLAHELGHGVHMFLSQPRGYYGAGTPLTTAETASVFGEMMVFNDLMARETDKQAKIGMLASKIEDTFATVFRQISMNRFENAIHTARREGGELTTERFTQHWMETQTAMFQGSVTLREDYGIWWSYIPHFINTPGYVYAYAFGELLVMALLAEYRKQGPDFAARYIEMLSMGGADSPANVVAKAGVNLNDPNFWAQGLGMIDDMVKQLEELVG